MSGLVVVSQSTHTFPTNLGASVRNVHSNIYSAALPTYRVLFSELARPLCTQHTHIHVLRCGVVGVFMVNLKGRRRTLGIAPEVSQES